jgi:hypothetical protein
VSNESGREEIYVVPYPGPGGKVQISRNGGRAPRWNPTGGELFYLGTENDLMVVDVDTAGALRASAPRRLFSMPPFWAAGRSYDVAPDGARFLVRRRSATTVQLAELRIVVNWAEDFERGTTGAGL